MRDIVRQYPLKRRYIPKITKHEENIQRRVCTYIRRNYPNVIFRSDYASGLHLTVNQAKIHASMQSGRSWPDLFIYEPMQHEDKFYCGLALELKRDGVTIKLKTGERKGKLTSDPHIREQAIMLRSLLSKGYYANFAVGYDEAISIINWYFKRKVPLNEELDF
jgi:hypothetical protein